MPHARSSSAVDRRRQQQANPRPSQASAGETTPQAPDDRITLPPGEVFNFATWRAEQEEDESEEDSRSPSLPPPRLPGGSDQARGTPSPSPPRPPSGSDWVRGSGEAPPNSPAGLAEQQIALQDRPQPQQIMQWDMWQNMQAMQNQMWQHAVQQAEQQRLQIQHQATSSTHGQQYGNLWPQPQQAQQISQGDMWQNMQNQMRQQSQQLAARNRLQQQHQLTAAASPLLASMPDCCGCGQDRPDLSRYSCSRCFHLTCSSCDSPIE